MAKKRTDREEIEAAASRGSKQTKKAPRAASGMGGRARPRPASAGGAKAQKPQSRAGESGRPRIRTSHGSAPLAESGRTTKSGARSERLRAVPTRAPGPSQKKPLPGIRRAQPRPEGPPIPAQPGPRAARRRSVPPPPPPVESSPSDASKALALAIASAGLDKKALGIEVLDVTGRVDYADFLVIMTGSSDRHVHAIATGIDDALRKKRVLPLSIEGLTAASWVLIDYSDVVVHVFQEETRRIYDIEGLWMDASRVEVASDIPDWTPAAPGGPDMGVPDSFDTV